MTTLKCSVAFAALALTAMPAEAGGGNLYHPTYEDYRSNTAGIERRIVRQHRRIKIGYREGRIPPQAKEQLQAHLHRIKEEFHYACEDDRVTRYERRHLRRLLDENSRRIAYFRYRERYDYGRRYTYKDTHKDVPPPYGSYKDDYREPGYKSYKDSYNGGYGDNYRDGYVDRGSKSLDY